MPATLLSSDHTEAKKTSEAGSNGAWKETEKGQGSRGDTDLAEQAIPIGGIFAESVSVEELQLVQRLFVLPRAEIPRVAVFCGAGLGDGAEFVCARAAEILASQVRDTVCLVDANLKDPKLQDRYDLDSELRRSGVMPHPPGKPGDGESKHNLWVLPASALRKTCQDLLPDSVREQLARLRKRFGFLLLCAPPLESAPDGYLLGQMSDGIVLTVRAHYTYRVTAERIRRLLESYDVRLLGAVLHKPPLPKSLVPFLKGRT